MFNEAYSNSAAKNSMTADEVRYRLRLAGNGGTRTNRVLLLAFRNHSSQLQFQSHMLLGCVSSTYSTPWSEDGWGHWGMLAVDKSGIYLHQFSADFAFRS
jgi:hypothetical protein